MASQAYVIVSGEMSVQAKLRHSSPEKDVAFDECCSRALVESPKCENSAERQMINRTALLLPHARYLLDTVLAPRYLENNNVREMISI